MALSKNTITGIFISIVVIIIAVVIWWIFWGSKKQNTKAPKSKNNVPVTKPNTVSPYGANWIDESFPLNVGMYGPYTQQLQAALGIVQDGQFGAETKAAVLSRGISLPMSYDDYVTVALFGQKIYAYSDAIFIMNSDLSPNNSVIKEGDYLGTIKGVSGISYLVDASGSSVKPPGDIYVNMIDVWFGDLK